MKQLTLTFQSEETRDLFLRLARAVPGVTVKTDPQGGDSSEPRFASEADMDEALGIQWKKN